MQPILLIMIQIIFIRSLTHRIQLTLIIRHPVNGDIINKTYKLYHVETYKLWRKLHL